MAYVTFENLPVESEKLQRSCNKIAGLKIYNQTGIFQIQNKIYNHITAFSNVCKTQAVLLQMVPKFMRRMAK
jgi:hypothetical protein